MSLSRLNSLKVKAKLLQKSKKRAGKPIALKEAFALLASQAGYASWREMKEVVEAHELLRPKHASAIWSVWYSSKEEATKHLEENGGYLLPFQKQFFICDDDYILNLGIALDDPDLAKVGHDFSDPNDFDAWQRLLEKIAEKKHS